MYFDSKQNAKPRTKSQLVIGLFRKMLWTSKIQQNPDGEIGRICVIFKTTAEQILDPNTVSP